MNKNKLIYLSGFFDGEGCICLSKTGIKKHLIRLQISVTQVDPTPIKIFAESFPGTYRSKWMNSNHRVQFEWGASGLRAIEALKQMLPYLIVKKKEAELAIEWYALPWRAIRRTAGGSFRKITEDQKKIDAEYFAKMRNFKHQIYVN